MPTGNLNIALHIGGVSLISSITRTATRTAAATVSLPAAVELEDYNQTDWTVTMTLPEGHGLTSGNIAFGWPGGRLITCGNDATVDGNTLTVNAGAFFNGMAPDTPENYSGGWYVSNTFDATVAHASSGNVLRYVYSECNCISLGRDPQGNPTGTGGADAGIPVCSVDGGGGGWSYITEIGNVGPEAGTLCLLTAEN